MRSSRRTAGATAAPAPLASLQSETKLFPKKNGRKTLNLFPPLFKAPSRPEPDPPAAAAPEAAEAAAAATAAKAAAAAAAEPPR